MNKQIKQKFPRFSAWLHNRREDYYIFLGKHAPVRLLKIWYKHVFKEDINLEHPQTIDEKINWMKLHSDMSLWSRCADKYEVRNYVKEHGLEFVLNDIYGVYDNADEIDFASLPQSFVIKSTNGGGSKAVLVVKDKDTLDLDLTRKQINGWLKKDVAHRYYEPHYLGIKPRLLVEKRLLPNPGEPSLVDYKVYCFHGQAYSVLVCSDRKFKETVHLSTYDLDWNPLPESIVKEYRPDKFYPRPSSLEKMIEYSNVLSEGIPFVRVDWYEIDGKPVFSEMTFTPGGAFQSFHSQEYRLELGNQLNLQESK